MFKQLEDLKQIIIQNGEDAEKHLENVDNITDANVELRNDLLKLLETLEGVQNRILTIKTNY